MSTGKAIAVNMANALDTELTKLTDDQAVLLEQQYARQNSNLSTKSTDICVTMQGLMQVW